MFQDCSSAKSRHKSSARRLGRDLRLWMPFIGLLCCYSLSATAIVVSERTTIGSRPTADHSTIASNSTSKASAAPGRMRGGMPRLP